MNETKKYVVYYNEDKEIIGYREHHFDWEEGDNIKTDGVTTTIFGIFDGTKKNMELAHYMIATLKKHEPHYKSVLYYEGVSNFQQLCESIFAGNMPQLKSETRQTTKKVWKNFDAKLDFVDAVMAEMD